MPLPTMSAIWRRVLTGLPTPHSSRRAKWVMVQNSSMTVAALSSADIALMHTATLSGDDAKLLKKRAVSAKNGLPGACPTSIA